MDKTEMMNVSELLKTVLAGSKTKLINERLTSCKTEDEKKALIAKYDAAEQKLMTKYGI